MKTNWEENERQIWGQVVDRNTALQYYNAIYEQTRSQIIEIRKHLWWSLHED